MKSNKETYSFNRNSRCFIWFSKKYSFYLFFNNLIWIPSNKHSPLQINETPIEILFKSTVSFIIYTLSTYLFLPWVHKFFFSYSLHAYILYVYFMHTTLKLCMILFLIQPWFGIQSFMLVVIQQSSTKYVLQTKG